MKAFKNNDFRTGVLFSCLGSAAGFAALENDIGTLSRMGPAFFPVIVSALLFSTGLLLIVRSFFSSDSIPCESLRFRMIVAVVAGAGIFSLVLEPLGLIAALILLVAVTSFANDKFRPLETLVLSLFISGVTSLLFVFGLGMHLALFPKII